MPNNISCTDNIQTEKDTDSLGIACSMKRRPSYVQSFCILQCITMSPKLKVYQVARMLGFDYYQATKRVSELSRKGFLRVANGSLTVTGEGMLLKEILARLIAMLHSDDAAGKPGNGKTDHSLSQAGLIA